MRTSTLTTLAFYLLVAPWLVEMSVEAGVAAALHRPPPPPAPVEYQLKPVEGSVARVEGPAKSVSPPPPKCEGPQCQAPPVTVRRTIPQRVR